MLVTAWPIAIVCVAPIAGLSEAQVRAIDDPLAPVWAPDERAALRIAGAMALTNPGGQLDEPLYREARAHFDDAQIFELGMTMAVLTGMAKFLFTYDLVDGVNNPVEVPELPYTDTTAGVTYNANQIRKVNVRVGVRSESISRITNDFVRNHISTSVDVRSLASVDRYQ